MWEKYVAFTIKNICIRNIRFISSLLLNRPELNIIDGCNLKPQNITIKSSMVDIILLRSQCFFFLKARTSENYLISDSNEHYAILHQDTFIFRLYRQFYQHGGVKRALFGIYSCRDRKRERERKRGADKEKERGTRPSMTLTKKENDRAQGRGNCVVPGRERGGSRGPARLGRGRKTRKQRVNM